MSEEYKQSQIAKDYGPKWSYDHSARPLGNAPVPVGNPSEIRLIPYGPEETIRNGGPIPPGRYMFTSGHESGPEIIHMPIATNVYPSLLLTEDRMREIVQSVLDTVFPTEQDGTLNTHRHRRVRQFDEDGTEWTGVLYPVEKE